MSQVINVCRKDKTRRIAIESNDLTLESLHSETLNLYPGLSKKNKCIDLVWKDEDGELVAVSSDQDLRDAMKAMSNKKLTFTIVIKKNPKNDLFDKKEPIDYSPKLSELKVGICRAWKKDGDDDVKEITLTGAVHQIKFKDVYQAAVAAYPGVARKFQKGKKTFILQWIDDEGDTVTVSTDDELHDAIDSMQENGNSLLFQIEKEAIPKNKIHHNKKCTDTLTMVINRIGLDGEPKKSRSITLPSPVSWKDVRQATFKAFPGIAQKVRKGKMNFALEMKREGSTVMISTEEELQEALEFMDDRNLPRAFDITKRINKCLTKGNAAVVNDSPAELECIVRRQKTGNTKRIRFVFPTDIASTEGSYLAFKAMARDAIAGLRPKQLDELELVLVKGNGSSTVIHSDEDLLNAVSSSKQNEEPLSFDIELIRKGSKMKKDYPIAVPVESVKGEDFVLIDGSLSLVINRIGRDQKPVKSRTISLQRSIVDGVPSQISWNDVRQATFKAFPGIAQKVRKGKMNFALEMKRESSTVMISTEEELQEALEFMENHDVPFEFNITKTVHERVVDNHAVVCNNSPAELECIVRRPKTGNTKRIRFVFPTDVASAEGSYLAFKTMARDAIAGLRPKQLDELELVLVKGNGSSTVIHSDEDLLTAVSSSKQNEEPLSFDIELIRKIRTNA